jgi:hypothetical protein
LGIWCYRKFTTELLFSSFLKTAFERRLIFKIGRSQKTGKDDVVCWAGIPHKTVKAAAECRHGFPG